MTFNLIYIYIYILFGYQEKNKSQFIGCSIMSRYPNPLYNQFAAELNLKLKPQEIDIQISHYTEYEVSIDSMVVCLWFTKSN